MIKDKLRNWKLYSGLNENIRIALEFLVHGNFSGKLEEVIEISGRDIYAVYKKYMTAETDEEAEAHRKYADIHYAVKGSEIIYYSNIDFVIQRGDYDEETDCASYTGTVEKLVLHEGEFAVLYPEDIHLPGIKNAEDPTIEKILVKVIM